MHVHEAKLKMNSLDEITICDEVFLLENHPFILCDCIVYYYYREHEHEFEGRIANNL